MRCYVPLTMTLLADAWAAGAVPAGERVLPRGQDEEAEYDALQEAADLSAGLLEGRPGRRVVVVAQAPDTQEPDTQAPDTQAPDTQAPDTQAPDTQAPVALRYVVAVHVDTEPVDPGDDDPPELGWFATQEVPDLLG